MNGRTLDRLALSVTAWSIMFLGSTNVLLADQSPTDASSLLASRCVRCHGPGEAEAGLRLDVRRSASTVQCARCHDHKFDPISQAEYYSLQAVFAGIDKATRTYDPDPEVTRRRRGLEARKAEIEAKRVSEDASLIESQLQEEANRWVESLPVWTVLETPLAERTREQQIELAAHYLSWSIDRELSSLPERKQLYCGTNKFVADRGLQPAETPRPIHVLTRGSVRSLGPLATPGTISCVPGLPAKLEIANLADEGARRAALAQWLSSGDNVLTWRSIVNRIWHFHFGRGLVATPNDFGQMGTPPSHPESLDWLALRFRENGGSLKWLHRLMVTSNVYQQSSRHHEDYAKIDSESRYLWRMKRRSLDAESIRDTILQHSGKLDLTMGGPPVKQFVETKKFGLRAEADYGAFNVDDPGYYRRGVYRYVCRTMPDPFMNAMDCPDASQRAPVRNTSITALQAAAMLNDPFLVRQCEHISQRLAKMESDRSDQIEVAYQLLYGRSPEVAELAAVLNYATQFGMANACRMLAMGNFSQGFLPAAHQGTMIHPTLPTPIANLHPPKSASYITPESEVAGRALLDRLNAKHSLENPGDSRLEARIATYELAFKMQMSVPEATDLSREPQHVHRLYGTQQGKESFANNCLLARRLVERGVRFVQLFDWGWDTHGNGEDQDLNIGFVKKCREIDQATAALLADLKQRGLLDETLVVWGGEFGRTPMRDNGKNNLKNVGRDHHKEAFTVWLAGGGVKRGVSFGETDEFGYYPVNNRVYVHDLQATILHCLGIDHLRLTYKYQGRHHRLTDVHGNVVREILA